MPTFAKPSSAACSRISFTSVSSSAAESDRGGISGLRGGTRRCGMSPKYNDAVQRSRDTLPAAVYTAAQVRAFDRVAIDERGIEGYELMCRAGSAALAVLESYWPEAHRIG